MPNLIVGQVSTQSARIWVWGHEKRGTALLRHRVAGSHEWAATSGAPLLEHLGHAAEIDLEGLRPATAYECELSFEGGRAFATGSFTTAPAA